LLGLRKKQLKMSVLLTLSVNINFIALGLRPQTEALPMADFSIHNFNINEYWQN
jgi:hypothetical protein